MRKLLSFHVTSLDGYYEGPGQAFDWPVVDAEVIQSPRVGWRRPTRCCSGGSPIR